jgi:hypothetical protein
MSRITHYKLCRGTTEEGFENAAHEALRAGWQPDGPLVSHGGALVQSWVRRDDDPAALEMEPVKPTPKEEAL